jgi:hypothetical protein
MRRKRECSNVILVEIIADACSRLGENDLQRVSVNSLRRAVLASAQAALEKAERERNKRGNGG